MSLGGPQAKPNKAFDGVMSILETSGSECPAGSERFRQASPSHAAKPHPATTARLATIITPARRRRGLRIALAAGAQVF